MLTFALISLNAEEIGLTIASDADWPEAEQIAMELLSSKFPLYASQHVGCTRILANVSTPQHCLGTKVGTMDLRICKVLQVHLSSMDGAIEERGTLVQLLESHCSTGLDQLAVHAYF